MRYQSRLVCNLEDDETRLTTTGKMKVKVERKVPQKERLFSVIYLIRKRVFIKLFVSYYIPYVNLA